MTQPGMVLSESLGDYLETIYRLIQDRHATRVKDIADDMGVHMSSVTGALKALVERGLIRHDPYSPVTLTPEGAHAAEELLRRHRTLAEFFRKVLGLDADAADRNACHTEHAIEPEALERLVRFLEFLERCPRTGPAWKEGLNDFCAGRPRNEDCARCLRVALERIERQITRGAIPPLAPRREEAEPIA